MKIRTGSELEDVIIYVQKRGRYFEHLRDTPYGVRYPATSLMKFDKSPRDLVKQIMKKHFPEVDISKY